MLLQYSVDRFRDRVDHVRTAVEAYATGSPILSFNENLKPFYREKFIKLKGDLHTIGKM